jgi:hypothetical protein
MSALTRHFCRGLNATEERYGFAFRKGNVDIVGGAWHRFQYAI